MFSLFFVLEVLIELRILFVATGCRSLFIAGALVAESKPGVEVQKPPQKKSRSALADRDLYFRLGKNYFPSSSIDFFKAVNASKSPNVDFSELELIALTA